MDSAATSWEADDQWELCNDDGFVYKRKKRRLDPAAAAAMAQPPSNADPEAEERNRREGKRRTLLKLEAQYQREMEQWELLSNTLRVTVEKACQSRSQIRLQQHNEREGQEQIDGSSASPLPSPEFVNSSLVDEFLLQVEAQEAIIQEFLNLCDIAEAICHAREEQLKESLINLPVWASPHELITSLCDD